MATVESYERPRTIEAAVTALGRPGAVALGGGTVLNAHPTATPVRIVDLQALKLDRIEPLDEGRLRIGAGVTLQALVEHPAVPRAVREAARRELPGTLRAVATVGGCVALAEADSELFAALLVHDAAVETKAGTLVIAVEIDTAGVCAWARTGRTRADRPIVAAFARRAPNGETRLALAGIAPQPVLVDPDDLDDSPDYRHALARTLAARALEGVE